MRNYDSSFVSSVSFIEKQVASFVRKHNKIAIVGLGNRYRTDDGAGLSVIDLLQAAGIDKSSNIFTIAAEDNFLNYLSEIEQNKPSGLLLIDAANMRTEPGRIMLLNEDQVVENNISTHEANMILGLACLRITIPHCQAMFIGIQFNSLELSEKPMLTEKMKLAVTRITEIIIKVVHGRMK